MKIAIRIIGLSICVLMLCYSANAQSSQREDRRKKVKISQKERFTFYQKLGLLRSQVDGDNMTGYDKTGFEIGAGVNYKLSRGLFLNLGLQYNKLGSVRPTEFEDLIPGITELGTDINAFGAQAGFMFRPVDKKIFISNSILFNRLTKFRAESYTFDGVVETPFELERSLRSSFLSTEFVFGLDLFQNFGIYASVFISFSNLIEIPYNDLRVMRPYHIGIGAYYRIIP